MRRPVRALACAAALCAAANLHAQDAPAAPAPPAPFFLADSAVAITLRTDLRTLLRDRDPDDAPWREGALGWREGDSARAVRVRLRTRGLFRLRECDFPPIRLRLAGDDVRGTPFDDLRRPKLVVPCRNNAQGERFVVHEYLLYRVYALVAPEAYATRLLRVTWEDSAGNRAPVTRWAFLVEDPEKLADRLQAREVDTTGYTMDWLTAANNAALGVFQYFVANTDWSVPGLHNIAMLRRDGRLVAVPYDFDWAGVIDAPYARPAAQLRIRSVRQRVYRGFCQDAAALEPVLARFEFVRDSIAALYRAAPALTERDVRDALRYYDEFYREIADRRRFVERVVEGSCLR